MAEALHLALLGGLRITRGGVLVRGFRSAKASALACYLAVTGRPHFREVLAGLLWGDMPDAEARKNLRDALSNLHKLLAPYLLITRDTVAFNRDAPYWLDVEVFQTYLQPSMSGRPDVARLRAAIALYHGDFLDGFSVRNAPAFEEWVIGQREHLRQLAVQALHSLAILATERKAYAAGAGYISRLLALDSLAEDAHRQLMLLLALAGQRDAALAQYETCRRILAAELGIEPATETTDLAVRIRAGAIVVPEAPAARRHHLPIPPTPLLGRDAERTQIARLLADPGCRLLTLVGPPGIGKTHLALQAAAEHFDRFEDDVCFVALAPMSDPQFVANAIAQALGVRDTGDQSLVERLKAYLREQHVLLVLDNFEHVLPAALLVAELLAVCPQLKVLVTSRVVLRLHAEHEVLLPSLALPDLAHLPGVETLARYPAVALFIQRAQAVVPDFQLTPANARTVAAICARLDGLPLAIELAAARLKLLPPPALLARLTNRLKLLTGGVRDLPTRQQTLRSTIDWSYNLLGAAEQVLFARLGVFVGGCTVEAIEAVCNARGDLPIDLLDGLATLLDHSLVRQVEGADGEPRFMMLETLREYALERLELRQEAGVLRYQHARYYLALAEAAEPDQGAWLDRLTEVYDDLRAALVWSRAALDDLSLRPDEAAEIGLRLATALDWFWYRRGLWSEGRRWLKGALAHPGGLSRTPVRAKALLKLGDLAFAQGDQVGARACYEESLALYRELEAQEGVIWVLSALGIAAREEGDAGRATLLLEESLTLAQEQGDTMSHAWAQCSLGEVSMMQGDIARATALLEESLAYFRDHQVIVGIAWVLNHLGHVAQLQGDYGRAVQLQAESLALFRQTDRLGTAWALYSLGDLAVVQGEVMHAIAHFGESLALFEELGDKKGLSWCLEGFASVASAVGQPERAARLWGAAEAQRAALGVRPPPASRAHHAGLMAAAQSELGAAAFAAAWAMGHAMTFEQALACTAMWPRC